MMIGLVLAGVALGAASGGVWILAGGSILVAFALYSLVGTLVVLGTAVCWFIISESAKADDRQLAGALQPSE